MADTGWVNGYTDVPMGGGGDFSWRQMPDQFVAEVLNGPPFTEDEAYLCYGYVTPVGENKAAGVWPDSGAVTYYYGGPDDLWGYPGFSSPSVVKDSNFGFIVRGYDGGGAVSDYLQTNSFPFSSIPNNSTVTGIEVRIGREMVYDTPYIYYVQARVTYSIPAPGSGTEFTGGFDL